MCHEHENGPRRRGRRGVGRHGFPSRQEWLERLEGHRERLEQDLANVRELIERLRDDQPQQTG
jgi:hypothetical protein